jgi:hypothetical protein
VHGKAGVITLADGRRLGFMGSMNETRSGWQRHYEILWEDESPEGVAWIEAEFEFLWQAASKPQHTTRRGRKTAPISQNRLHSGYIVWLRLRLLLLNSP